MCRFANAGCYKSSIVTLTRLPSFWLKSSTSANSASGPYPEFSERRVCHLSHSTLLLKICPSLGGQQIQACVSGSPRIKTMVPSIECLLGILLPFIVATSRPCNLSHFALMLVLVKNIIWPFDVVCQATGKINTAITIRPLHYDGVG